MTKTERHLTILDILRHEGPTDRNVLREMLRKRGFDVSERTLIRDETELQCSGRVKVYLSAGRDLMSESVKAD